MILKIERLLLRPWRVEDAEDLYTYAGDPEVGRLPGGRRTRAWKTAVKLSARGTPC